MNFLHVLTEMTFLLEFFIAALIITDVGVRFHVDVNMLCQLKVLRKGFPAYFALVILYFVMKRLQMSLQTKL